MMGPLAGLKVIDLTHVMAGPTCTLMLADMGADVIKVEKTPQGDDSRHMIPPQIGEESAAFLMMNRNKRGVVIDLKTAGGKKVLRRLVESADVLVENFAPGVMDRFGFAYDEVRAYNPELIYCSLSGFGRSGPYRTRRGLDLIAQAMSGLMSITGESSDRPPIKCGAPLSDITAGIIAAMGILAAYAHRLRTGEGQRVDIAMADSIAALAELPIFTYGATGHVTRREGSRNMAPFGAFPAADGHVAIGVIGDAVWRRFCEAIERPDLRDDPELATGRGRAAHLEDRVRPALEGWLRDRPKAEAAAYLAERQVPAAPVLDAREVTESPHFRARQMVLEFDYPGAGTFRASGNPIKLGADPSPPVRRPPLLGEHTDAVLRDLAGLTDEEIAELRADGAIG